MTLLPKLHKLAADVMWDPETRQMSTKPTRPSEHRAAQQAPQPPDAVQGRPTPDMMDMENTRLQKVLDNAKLRLQITRTEQRLADVKADRASGAKLSSATTATATKNPATKAVAKVLGEKARTSGKQDKKLKAHDSVEKA